MQTAPTGWADIVAGGSFRTICELRDDRGRVFTEISPPKVYRPMSTGPLTVGACLSACMEVTLLGTPSLNRGASLQLMVKVADDTAISDAAAMGTFYVGQRTTDPVAGTLSLTCYDGMLKSDGIVDFAAVPMTVGALVTLIADRIGAVGVDARSWATADRYGLPQSGGTVLRFDPGDSYRSILERIARAYGGNFIITPQNELRFILVTDRNGQSQPVAQIMAVLQQIRLGATYGVGEVISSVGRVLGHALDYLPMVVDLGDSPLLSTAQFGEVSLWLVNTKYRPADIRGAITDPLVEVGDYVERDGVSLIVSEMTATFGALFQVDIYNSPPDGIDGEYPYQNKVEQLEKHVSTVISSSKNLLKQLLIEQGVLRQARQKSDQIATAYTDTVILDQDANGVPFLRLLDPTFLGQAPEAILTPALLELGGYDVVNPSAARAYNGVIRAGRAELSSIKLRSATTSDPVIETEDAAITIKMGGTTRSFSLVPTRLTLVGGANVTVARQSCKTRLDHVIAHGALVTSAQMASGDVILTGLPAPGEQVDAGLFGSGAAYRVYINTSGEMCAAQTIPAGALYFNLSYFV